MNESKPENMLSKTAAILRALATMLEIMNIPVNPLIADFVEKVSVYLRFNSQFIICL